METIDGKAVQLLSSRSAPGCVIDTWETDGATFGTGIVVTVMTGRRSPPSHSTGGLASKARRGEHPGQ